MHTNQALAVETTRQHVGIDYVFLYAHKAVSKPSVTRERNTPFPYLAFVTKDGARVAYVGDHQAVIIQRRDHGSRACAAEGEPTATFCASGQYLLVDACHQRDMAQAVSSTANVLHESHHPATHNNPHTNTQHTCVASARDVVLVHLDKGGPERGLGVVGGRDQLLLEHCGHLLARKLGSVFPAMPVKAAEQ